MTERTQLTYVPERASWFLWSAHTPDPLFDAPAGTIATMRLAVPENGEVIAREVRGLEVALREGWAWLGGRQPSPQDGGSLRSWTLLAGRPDARVPLPVAGHCALTPDGAHVLTAEATTDRLRSALTLTDSLAVAGLTATLRGYQLAGVQWLLDRDGGELGVPLGSKRVVADAILDRATGQLGR